MQNDQKDKKDDDYRDDANEFGASSDFAQGRPVGNYTGDGPGQGPYTVPEKGTQDWQAGEAAMRDGDAGANAASGDGEVVSRSADPGQSSYGGFKDEGPVPEDVQHRQAAALRDGQRAAGGSSDAAGAAQKGSRASSDVGGIAASDARLGASLPDGASSSDTQTGEAGGSKAGGSTTGGSPTTRR